MNLTFAFGAQGHAHVGAEPAAERVLDTPHFGSDAEAAFHPRPALGSATASHAIFNFAHREALCDCFAREIHQDVADAVGRDRSTVANALRLLKLPEIVLQMLHEAQLSVGHARALLGLEDLRIVTNLAREAVAQGLSVREVEDR